MVVKVTNYQPNTHTEFMDCFDADYEYDESGNNVRVFLYDEKKKVTCSRDVGTGQKVEFVEDGKVIDQIDMT